jgi:glycosyltransferase involved in cell wall biosynthesis
VIAGANRSDAQSGAVERTIVMNSQSGTIVAGDGATAKTTSRLHVALAYWDPYSPGGVQSQVAGRLNSLGSPAGPVRYTLFTRQCPPRPSPWPHIRTVRFRGWDWGSIAISEYTAAQQLVRRLAEIHREDPIDLLELHASGFGPGAARWARGEKIPCLYVSHSLHCFERGSSGMRWDALQYYAWANRRTARECSRILAVSHSLKQHWMQLGVSDERVEVQHTATDGCGADPKSRSQNDESVQLLFVGRISPEKGLDVLIDAVYQCTQVHRQKMHLTVVGAMPEQHPLIEDVARRQLPVTFAGAKSNAAARAMMAETDVVVIPSRHDYCPLVAIEALQAGAIVVASRVGGLPEMIDDGETGILVPSDDSAALAGALCRLATDRSGWSSLRDAARSAGRRFTWCERGPQILDLYRRLLEARA